MSAYFPQEACYYLWKLVGRIYIPLIIDMWETVDRKFHKMDILSVAEGIAQKSHKIDALQPL